MKNKLQLLGLLSAVAIIMIFWPDYHGSRPEWYFFDMEFIFSLDSIRLVLFSRNPLAAKVFGEMG
ncbi:MAG: hypothetical protein R2822_20875 [Spirosomataceae bacterium]